MQNAKCKMSELRCDYNLISIIVFVYNLFIDLTEIKE